MTLTAVAALSVVGVWLSRARHAAGRCRADRCWWHRRERLRAHRARWADYQRLQLVEESKRWAQQRALADAAAQRWHQTNYQRLIDDQHPHI